MKYYRAIINSIYVTDDNNINTYLNDNYFFVSESLDLRYLRRLVRKVKLTNNGGLGDYAILLNYDPYSDCYNLLDVFRIGIN